MASRKEIALENAAKLYLGELPQQWERAHLSDLSDLQCGYAFKSKWFSKSGIRLLRGTNIVPGGLKWEDVVHLPVERIQEFSEYQLFESDIVIAMDRPLISTGLKIAQLSGKDTPALLLQRVGRFNLTKAILPNYLLSFLKSWIFITHIGGQATGTQLPHISATDIKTAPLPLPPLKEQHRIVTKIEALTTHSRKARQALDTIPALLDQFRQSVLAAAFRGDLTADWRSQNPDVEPAEKLLERIREIRSTLSESTRDKNRLKKDWSSLLLDYDTDLPENWLRCCIGHIGNVCNGSTPSRKQADYWAGTIPWVSSGEVRNNLISNTRESITQEGFKNSSVRILPVGTVLIAMIGEGKTRGQTSVLSLEATTNQNIAAVILDHHLIESHYLWYWFQFQYSENRRVGSGSGPQALNCQRVREMSFNLPPLSEQKMIVSHIENLLCSFVDIESAHSEATCEIDQLDQSILAKAFRGQLVPQDPTDEPASLLLKRIQAEREKLQKKGKGKKGKGEREENRQSSYSD